MVKCQGSWRLSQGKEMEERSWRENRKPIIDRIVHSSPQSNTRFLYVSSFLSEKLFTKRHLANKCTFSYFSLGVECGIFLIDLYLISTCTSQILLFYGSSCASFFSRNVTGTVTKKRGKPVVCFRRIVLFVSGIFVFICSLWCSFILRRRVVSFVGRVKYFSHQVRKLERKVKEYLLSPRSIGSGPPEFTPLPTLSKRFPSGP